MTESDAMSHQSSASGPAPNDGSVVARSDPFSDLRPFIKHLWTERSELCRNIFPDQFPRGIDGKGATKDEEDEFMLRYFSPEDLHVQGGRFLKQVLYSIARYNEDKVLEFAGRWAQSHNAFYKDCNSEPATLQILLEEAESANYTESFLSRVVTVINYGLSELRIAQSQAYCTSVDRGSISSKRGGRRYSIDASRNEDPLMRFAIEPLVPALENQKQQQKLLDASRAEPMHHGPSTQHAHPRSTQFAPRQIHKQEHPLRHRRSSGSAHTPSMFIGPLTPMQNMSGFGTPGNYPEFDSNFPGVPGAQPGYTPTGYPIASDARFMAPNIQGNPDLYTPPQYGTVPRSRMSPYVSTPVQSYEHPAAYYPVEADPRYVHHQRSGSFSHRGSRLSFSNNTKVVDPNSFSRFSDDRVTQQRAYIPKNGRRPSFFSSVRPRRQSVRSSEGWQTHSDNRHFDGSQRRVYSDQRPGQSALIPGSKRGGREARSRSDVGDGAQPPDLSFEQLRNYQQNMPVSDYDPDWGCTEDCIGNRRVDVTHLVASNIPPDFSVHDIERYLVKQTGCIRVVPRVSQARLIIFVNFRNMYDTQMALGRRDLKLRGVNINFKVPFRYWMKQSKSYVSPSEAKTFVESALYSGGRTGQPFFGDKHQWRVAGEPEYFSSSSLQNRIDIGSEIVHPYGTFVPSQEARRSMSHNTAPILASPSAISYSDGTILESVVNETVAPAAVPTDYSGPSLPSLSEASTPRQKTPKKNSRKGKSATPSAKSSFDSLRTEPRGNDLGQTASTEIEKPSENELCRPHSAPEEPATTVERTLVVEELGSSDKGPSTTNGATQQAESMEAANFSPSEATSTNEDLSADGSNATVPSGEFSELGNMSPKQVDDVDDSFQTAVETPESATRAFTPNEVARTPIDDAAATTPSPALNGSRTTTAAVSPISVSSTSSKDTTSIMAGSTSQILLPHAQVSKKTLALKPGPKQTESLSPFARQSHAKKKDVKLKAAKGKTKTKSEPARGQDMNQAESNSQSNMGPKEIGSIQTEGDPQRSLQDDTTAQRAENGVLPPNASEGVDSSNSMTHNDLQTATKTEETKPQVEPASGQVFSKIISATTRIGHALSGINSSKAKTDIGLTKTEMAQPNGAQKVSSVQSKEFDGSDSSAALTKINTENSVSQTACTSSSDQVQAVTPLFTPSRTGIQTRIKNTESVPVAYPSSQGSAVAKKPITKKKKQKQNAKKNIASVRDDDPSSAEGVIHEALAAPSSTLTAPTQSYSSPSVSLQPSMGLNILDTRLSGLGLREGSVITLSANSVGYQNPDTAGNSTYSIVGEDSASETNDEVERSRRKLQEMAKREQILRQKKG